MISFTVQTIHHMAHPYSFAALTLSLLLTTQLIAQGDTCTTALPVVTGVHLANGPNTGDAGPCGSGQDGDWYVYTPTFTGTITISSCHPLNTLADDDTYLKVMIGSCDTLECIAYNDDAGGNICSGNSFASYLEVDVEAGEDYFIVWTDVFDGNPFYWELNECVGTVAGVTFDDNNDNGVRDTDEGHVNVMLLVQPGSHYIYSGQDPYSFCSEFGAHTISVPTPPLYHTAVPPTRSYDITAQGQQVLGADFAFQSTPGIYDASVSLFGWNPWIGNNTTLNVAYANIGTESIGATVTLTLDPLTSYVSASVPATTVAGQVITWDLGSLAEGTAGNIQVTIYTSPAAAPNAPVMQAVNLSTSSSDFDATNNVDELHGFCTTSFDPNDKAVNTPSMTPAEVAEQEKLEYTIRFQNTGNAPAVNVVIRDMLDSGLDLSTFEMVGATHPYGLTLLDNEAIWTFEGIMLPDSSTDQLGSQGALHFRAAPKSTLILGDVVSNRADIYFDYNEPVLTNTVETVVALSTTLAERDMVNGMTVHPSPSDGHISLRWTMTSAQHGQILIMDALGRTVHTQSVMGNTSSQGTNLDLSSLSAGTYVASMRHGDHEARTRFVIR